MRSSIASSITRHPFFAFCSKYRKQVQSEHPKWTTKQIVDELAKMWQGKKKEASRSRSRSSSASSAYTRRTGKPDWTHKVHTKKDSLQGWHASEPVEARHKALHRAVRKNGKDVVIKKLVFLQNVNKNKGKEGRERTVYKIVREDLKWLEKDLGKKHDHRRHRSMSRPKK